MKQKTTGRLWIVASPSGGGKTSLVEASIANMARLVRSVSFTTRQKRPAEVDGKDYVFVETAVFEQLMADKKMLEYEQVFGNYYGTSLAFIEKYLSAGDDVVLTIDWQGARQVRKRVPESKSIFILPPKLSALEKRLKKRAQDSDDIVAKRMAEAKAQVSHYQEFDYLIINDDFEQALSEMQSVFLADRLLRCRQEIRHQQLIEELL